MVLTNEKPDPLTPLTPRRKGTGAAMRCRNAARSFRCQSESRALASEFPETILALPLTRFITRETLLKEEYLFNLCSVWVLLLLINQDPPGC